MNRHQTTTVNTIAKKAMALKPNWFLSAAIALSACCLPTLAWADAPFDDQVNALSVDTPSQPEAAILAMLEAGIDEQKPTQALALSKRWLSQNSVENPLLLYYAGLAAERAGDWNDAVALYRQYLLRADLQSDTASQAILASYTLQINHLAAPDSAYSYSKTNGHRLVESAQARQFDRWFLDLAIQRNDLEAVAARLLALLNAKVDNDLVIARYQTYFRWLLQSIANGRLDQPRFSKSFIETVKSLSQAISFDDELRLLLNWEVSVKAYNLALLNGEQLAPPIEESRALLEAFPHMALRVQTGWAGGSNGLYYRDDPKKYWPVDLDAKLAPIKLAVAKLDETEQSKFYLSWSINYYQGGPIVLDAEQAR